MTSAILVTGWAHGRSSLMPLAQALESTMTCRLCSPHDLAPDYAQSLKELVQTDQANILIGWSLGGLISLETAFRGCSLVKRLILISSTSRFCRGPGYECGVPVAAIRALRAGLRRNAAETLWNFYRQVHSSHTPSFDTQAQLHEAMGWPVEDLDRGLAYLMTTDLRAQLPSLRIPLLLVHGEADPIIPTAASAYIASCVPRAQRHVLPGKGHDLPMAAASDIAQYIEDFLHCSI